MPRVLSIVPEDPDREVDNRLGLAWREVDEADTELEKLIENLRAGQSLRLLHLREAVAMDIVEQWLFVIAATSAFVLVGLGFMSL